MMSIFIIISALHFLLASTQLYRISIDKGVQLNAPLFERQGSLLPNNSMIRAALFTAQDNNYDGIVDALYCQSANSASNIGVWYYPNGTQVPIFTGGFNDHRAPRPLFSKRFSGQIALARKDGLAGNEGLYRCVIPDENDASQTLVIGIYTVATFNSYDGLNISPSMKFSLITPRFANTPVFTLSFNVTHGPPTNITCTIGTNPLTVNNTDLSRVIIRGPRVTKVQVTVTVRMKQAGTYRCTASITRVIRDKIVIVTANSSSLLTVSVADKPSSFTATRLNSGLTHVRLSWSPVSGVVGYEVFYQPLGDIITSLANITTSSMDITSGLSLDMNYIFFIISYGNGPVLPSDQSMASLELTSPSVSDLTVTTITITSVSLTWSHPSFIPQSYSIARGCRKFCEQSVTTIDFNSISSPYESNGINPGSECSFKLYGVYNNNLQVNLSEITLTTLTTAPISSVRSVTISSVKARSMRVSWGEVPCNGQNGPITGYWLYYTNTTFNSSSVEITGRNNREYHLDSLTPYTIYTVTIRPYNEHGIGPVNGIIQQTVQDKPSEISNLRLKSIAISTFNISWDVPSAPNGVIIVYEIVYANKSINTTTTQYTTVGLKPGASYLIKVRAYTIIGAGKWTRILASSSVIPGVSRFYTAVINETSIKAVWNPIDIGGVAYYTVYYRTNTGLRNVTFPASTNKGVIGNLITSLYHSFAISATLNVSGILYEGKRSSFVETIELPSTSFLLIGGFVISAILVIFVVLIMICFIAYYQKLSIMKKLVIEFGINGLSDLD